MNETTPPIDRQDTGIGQAIHNLMARLFPICRSITGDGVRRTLQVLSETVPLEVHEVPTGTQVLDWTVPREWNIRDAYIKNAAGRCIVDFRQSNLHVVNYSTPIHATMTLEALRPHLYSLPDHPDWIPYRTSYYKETWGFCLSHRKLTALTDGEYEVCIDATLADGHLTYGEHLVPGAVTDEVLVSTHICHPSMANDNLSGVAVAAMLAAHLSQRRNRYTYRFVFVPGTIGAITWLQRNREQVGRIKHGLVLTGVGDPGALTYKKSRRGDADIDHAAQHLLRMRAAGDRVIDFSPYGYDERQYCSPGFNLPVGRLSRTPFGEYPQYHTSADNLQFVRPAALADSFSAIRSLLAIVDNNAVFTNRQPHGEPQLGRRGLYDSIGPDQMAMLWVLNLSDGGHSLLDIAVQSDLPFASVQRAAALLKEHELLE